MDNVIDFPRIPKPENLTEHEIAYYMRLREDGYDEDAALEIVVMPWRIRGTCHGG